MERHLSLIKTEYKEMEKRIFPRFPFGLMMFRESSKSSGDNKVFEVKDISLTGMQISIKDGSLGHSVGDKIFGNLQWRESGIEIEGRVIGTGSISLVKVPGTRRCLASASCGSGRGGIVGCPAPGIARAQGAVGVTGSRPLFFQLHPVKINGLSHLYLNAIISRAG